jgi:hypothetical protein
MPGARRLSLCTAPTSRPSRRPQAAPGVGMIKLSDTDIAIILWARRNAPDVTIPEIAVSRHLPLRAVKRVAKGVTAEVPSKVAEYRRTIGLLAARLYEATGETWEEIAEQAGCTRQHLHKCREEAQRGG